MAANVMTESYHRSLLTAIGPASSRVGTCASETPSYRYTARADDLQLIFIAQLRLIALRVSLGLPLASALDNALRLALLLDRLRPTEAGVRA